MTARILVVDDVPANVRLLEARLSAEYYEVRTVHEARRVLDVAVAWQPDVVLLDVMMPDLDGYEVCRRLKADPLTAHIPVIMVTALKEPPERCLGLSCGADEFLTKPVEHEILSARLRGIIRLKQLVDEWQARGASAAALGLRFAAPPGEPAGGGRALIVDDLATRAERLRDVLAGAGIAAALAPQEGEGLAAAEGGGFDLIVVSLSLMTGDPLRLVARLRAAAATRDTPVLLIAEPDQTALLVAGLDLGASDCIMLPLNDEELLLRAASHLRRKQYQDRLRDDVGSALQMAVIDPLTQLYNRRYLTSHLDHLCSEPAPRKFAVLMIDVDHFKTINDRFGHPAGDSVLRGVAEILRANLRKSDMVSRYGGEEFVAVVGALSDERRALAVAEKLRLAIEEMRVEAYPTVTVSIGVAVSRPSASAVSLIEQADNALYTAKRHGRNMVALHAPEMDRRAPAG